MISLKKKIIYSLIILCLIIIGLFIFAEIAKAEESENTTENIVPNKLLISQIQITGGPGLTTNDFVKIYNPNNFDINLKGYRLVKRTKTGENDTSLKSWTTKTIILANDYHLWANSKDGFADSLSADSSTTQTLTNNNGLAIRFGANNDGEIIDSLCWGECVNGFAETSAFPNNPGANQILFRIDNLDTDNNANDFALPQENNTNDQEESNSEENNQEENNQENNEEPQENISPEPVPSSPPSSSHSPPNSSAPASIIFEKTKPEPEPIVPKSAQIYISEILPNPLGLDQPDCFNCGEFIELYNAGEETVSLYHWQIKVDNRPGFIINHYLPIKPEQRIVFYKNKTNLVLKNNQGEVKLYEPDSDKIKQQVKYKTANEGASYNLMSDLKNWHYSQLISPNQKNTINYQPEIEFYMPVTANINEEIIFDASDTYDQDDTELNFTWDFGDGNKSTDKNPLHYFIQPGKYTVQLTVSDSINKVNKKKTIKIKEEKQKGEKKKTTNANTKITIAKTILPPPIINNRELSVKGVVIVLPGVLGSQFFYILPMQSQNTLENTALQIYSYNKTFPVLAVGDYIQVTGELSEIKTETRLKIKQPYDIQILEHDYIVIEREIKADQINEELVNQLVSVIGKVISKNRSNIIIYDGSAEAIIYLSPDANINKALVINNNYKIIGLARQTKSGIKIMPRSTNDIILINETGDNKTKNNKKIIPVTEVLGEKIAQDNNKTSKSKINKTKTIIIPPRNQKEKLLEYALIIFAGIIIGLLIYITKLHRKNSS